MGQNSMYAYVAMERAIEDSGLTPEQYQSNTRVGGIIGQADTSAVNIEETIDAVKTGARAAAPPPSRRMPLGCECHLMHHAPPARATRTT